MEVLTRVDGLAAMLQLMPRWNRYEAAMDQQEIFGIMHHPSHCEMKPDHIVKEV